MSADDAKALCIKPEEAVNKRRLDRAKANYLSPASQTDWFELVDFDIGNGTQEELADHAGAMVPWTPKPIFDGVSYEAIDAVLDMIEAGMPPDGIRFSKDETAKDRWVVPHMTALDEIWTEDRARVSSEVKI
ncbi:conserved hypothetical protein [Ricinus communis]|uniref:Uncharacterized protein n=1 Tax=Ricinus communis TaxID=3988 RepID=B9TQT6_RICCO|nr:conserved hypothetical protein [Ricinus communis]